MQAMWTRIAIVLVCACSSNSAPEPAPAPPPAAAKPAPAAKPTPAPAVVVMPEKQEGGAHPWGAPIVAPDTDLAIMRALSKIATGDAKAIDTVSEALVVGPALWAGLLEVDKDNKPPQFAKLGTDSKAIVPVDGKTHTLPMRTFIDAKDRKQLLASQSFRELATLFASGKPRPASDRERRLLYALVPFEIATTPVTVIDTSGGLQLLVVLEKGRLFWLDIPNMYGADFTINGR